MTTASALSKFDILLDKYGSPYFEESEKLEFLNMAQNEVLNRMIPDSLGGVVNFEADSNIASNLRNLIIFVTKNTTTGEITFSDIVSTVRSASGDSQADVLRIMAVSYRISSSSQIPVKYTSWNNWYKHQQNVYKTPSLQFPVYTILNQGNGSAVLVSPIPTSSVFLTVLKTPVIMTAGNSPDWDDYVMNQVILQAVKLAGVPLRDSELILDTRNTGMQSAN